MLIITRGAFATIVGPDRMVEAGLNNEAVEVTWRSMLRLASRSAAGTRQQLIVALTGAPMGSRGESALASAQAQRP